jgi:hypothetical protein
VVGLEAGFTTELGTQAAEKVTFIKYHAVLSLFLANLGTA